jgi:hypothetical protein
MALKRVEQRESYDCLRASLATILKLPYEEVPEAVSPPVHDWSDKEAVRKAGSTQHEAMQAFLRTRGLVAWSFGLHGQERPYVKFGNTDPEWCLVPPGFWLASVQSPRIDEPHVVVMRHDRIAWDPHPMRDEGHRGFREAHILIAWP